jgi:SAM-dependent methyltransferase
MSVVNAAAATADFEFAALQEARNYRAALAREFGPNLKGRVMEVGAGIGQMTAAFATLPGVAELVAVEPDARFHDGFRAGNPKIRLVPGVVADLKDPGDWDAMVAINVLEHIEHDLDELKRWKSLLAKRRGAVCLFIPARPEIYALIDKDFGHFRRYTRADGKRGFSSLSMTG